MMNPVITSIVVGYLLYTHDITRGRRVHLFPFPHPAATGFMAYPAQDGR